MFLVCSHSNYDKLKLFYVEINLIGLTIGILLLNKGTSGFTSNTLLIPKLDHDLKRKPMRGKVEWNEIINEM